MNENIKDFEIHGITGYTVMSNYHLRDPNLSFKAKGLLSMMLSMPKDWDYSISGLEKGVFICYEVNFKIQLL